MLNQRKIDAIVNASRAENEGPSALVRRAADAALQDLKTHLVEHENAAILRWNAEAGEFNQWNELSFREKLELIIDAAKGDTIPADQLWNAAERIHTASERMLRATPTEMTERAAELETARTMLLKALVGVRY